MSATDTIRAMLNERGVEWRERVWGGKHSVTIFWHARGVRWHYRENRFGEVRLHADGLSPEQAIEATLGRGECEARLYKPEHGVSDCTICECGEINDISANHCNRCGRRIKVVRA